MFRIFCESYENYISQYKGEECQKEYRYKMAQPLRLIKDLDRYQTEKKNNTAQYRQLCDLLFYMNKQVERFPKFNAFLWTLESRGIIGQFFGIVPKEDLDEQVKLMNMFLNLLYWDSRNESHKTN